NLGLKLEEVREEVLNLLGAGNENDESGTGGASGSSGPGASAAGGEAAAAGGGGGGGAPGERAAKGKSRTPALDSFGRDLTELAKENQLDPVIGRINEIERLVQVLCRRTKNNPV